MKVIEIMIEQKLFDNESVKRKKINNWTFVEWYKKIFKIMKATKMKCLYSKINRP